MGVVVGSITGVSGTGNHDVTGIGFQPVGVIFWGVDQGLENPNNFFGAASGSGEEWCCWTGLRQQASGYTQRRQEIRDDACIFMYEGTDHTTVLSKASFVSFLSDGFRINYSEVGGDEPTYYMAIGGNNISDAHAGTFTVGSSTGTTAETGAGFEPNALLVAHTGNAALNTQGAGAVTAVGATDGTNHYSMGTYAVPGSATAGDHIYRTDSIASFSISTLGTYRLELDSFDSDGFTVDVTDAWVANIAHGYLAIESAAAAVGELVQPDSTGTQSGTTSGFEPAGVLFFWNGADTPSTSGSTSAPTRPGVGGMTAFTGASNSYIHRDNAPFGAYVPDAYSQSPETILIRGRGSQVDPFAHEEQGVAEFSSFAQGSFTVAWTAVTSGADRSVGWLALPGDLPVDWIPSIYRRIN